MPSLPDKLDKENRKVRFDDFPKSFFFMHVFLVYRAQYALQPRRSLSFKCAKTFSRCLAQKLLSSAGVKRLLAYLHQVTLAGSFQSKPVYLAGTYNKNGVISY